MNRVIKLLVLFLIGGAIYIIIEIAWRGHTHPAMFAVGGLCFVLVGQINECFTWTMPLLWQGFIATGVILIVEFVSGCILNLWLKLGVWDYSTLHANLFGQVCLAFAALWYVLSIGGIILDDYLRYWLFKEEKPRYRIV